MIVSDEYRMNVVTKLFVLDKPNRLRLPSPQRGRGELILEDRDRDQAKRAVVAKAAV